MARLPDPHLDDAALLDLVEVIRERRGGELLNLDRMLLHSPALATAWNGFFGAVRSDLSVPARLSELATCCVAVANRAEYEYAHHAPLYLAAGASPEQAEALRDLATAVTDETMFDHRERAVIALSVEMTRDVKVSAATFGAAQAALGDSRHLVELVGIIAAYNLVSRFLVALEVEPEG